MANTTNYNLYKPLIGDLDWAGKWNENADNIDNTLKSHETSMNEKAKIPTTGGVRGTNATDFQFIRTTDSQVAGAINSFIAGGSNNKVQDILERDCQAKNGYAEGYGNRVHEWHGHAEGSTCIVDGKISHAEGNTVICTANDSHAEGNMTVAGRRYYPNCTYGSEDAGSSLGVLNYVLIPDVEGDVTSYFPNLLTDNLVGRYGTGVQMDTKGNIYASIHVPAVWTGNVPTTKNDLRWALHSICIVRGPGEVDIEFINIAKSVYTAGVGTKIYYFGSSPFSSIVGIYTSYSPTVVINGLACVNGQHAEGLKTSTYGAGSHAEGYLTRAWGAYSHAEGGTTTASGECSHAEGNQSIASGKNSHAEGLLTVASGMFAHAEGSSSKATADHACAKGFQCIASGYYSHAEGESTQASGIYSRAEGLNSKATRAGQQSLAVGKNTNVGDNQTSRLSYITTVTDVGWFPVWIIKDLEDGKAYNIETMVLGRQSAGSAETIGNTFAYKFQALVIKSGGIISNIGTPIRTLIGRSASMSGDGLTTGVRCSFGTAYSGSTLLHAHIRYDGVLNTTFVVQTYSTIQEMGL